MSKDAYYFSHDSNAKDDYKCVMLIDELGLEGYGIFWILVEILRDQPNYRYPLKLLPSLAKRYSTSAQKVETVVRGYGLFEITEDEFFYSNSLNNRMLIWDNKRKKCSEAGKKGNQIKWGNNEITEEEKHDYTNIRAKRLAEAKKKGKHTNDEWNEMVKFFNNQCVICGKEFEVLTKDHIVPIYQDGSDSITNLQPTCRSCNSRKGNDTTDYRQIKCHANASLMPSKWLTECPTNKIKEKKVKESKEKNNNNYFENPLLQEALTDFIEMRKAQKGGITEKAIELMLNRLDKIGTDDENKIEILNQSTMNGYKGIFPVKEENITGSTFRPFEED